MNHSGYRYPFTPYPNGWYKVANSSDVTFHKPLEKRLFGGKVLISRTSTNQVQTYIELVGRFCETLEIRDIIFAYVHLENKDPEFLIPDLPEFDHADRLERIRLHWNARVHIQEVAENAVDLAHFCTVHTYTMVPKISSIEFEGATFQIIMDSRRRVLGRIIDTSLAIKYYGMGVVVARVQSRLVNLFVVLTTTPVDEENITMNMHIAMKKQRGWLLDKAARYLIAKDIFKEFYNDIPVWESKLYHTHPMICRGEGDIMRVRRWCQQFYAPKPSTP